MVCLGALTPSIAAAATVLPQPTNLAAQHVSDTAADLEWNSTGLTAGDVVQRQVNGSWQQFATGTYGFLALTNLTPGTTYTFRVFATPISTDYAASPPSAPVSFTTLSGPDTVPPSKPPTPVADEITTTVADVFWLAATDNVQVTGYDLQELIGGAWTTIRTVTASGNFQTVTGLTPATSYTFAVIAFDARGNLSPRSNPVTLTTLATTPNPSCVVQTELYNPGFTATVTITNTTPADLTGWVVHFTLPATATITNSFSGTLTRNGSVGTIVAPYYAATIGQGGQMFPGFLGSDSPFVPPSDFTLNGLPCTQG